MAAYSFVFPVPGTPTGLGYQLSFFQAGTATPANVYHTSAPGTAWSQPIVFNADGQPPSGGQIYCVEGVALKVVYLDADDVAVPGYPADSWFPPLVS